MKVGRSNSAAAHPLVMMYMNAWSSGWALMLHMTLLVLQGAEVQDEEELEDDGDYEENGRGADEGDVDGESALLREVPS